MPCPEGLAPLPRKGLSTRQFLKGVRRCKTALTHEGRVRVGVLDQRGFPPTWIFPRQGGRKNVGHTAPGGRGHWFRDAVAKR
jgi:hypothetical protein